MSEGPDRRQAGFTLTETLVAVALLALVAAAAVPVLRGGADAHARLTEAAEARASHAALERTVRDTLAAAVTLPGSGFQGGAARVRFTAHPSGAPAPVAITMEGGRRTVTLTARPVSGEGSVRRETLETRTDFAGFYFYGRHDDEPPGWRRSWSSATPPRLVVLDLAPTEAGSPQRIEAVLGGRAVLACDYDSGLQACREGI